MFVPAIRAYEDDVRNTTGSSVLKRIVENDDVAFLSLRLFNTNEPIRRNDDRNVGIQRPMNEGFVLSVPTKDDRRLRTRAAKPAREVRSQRSLPGAAHREVPDAQRRNCGRPSGEYA